MINIPKGYYIKARNIKDSKISIAPPYIREIWDWILRESNHKDKIYNGRKIARGECIRTFKDIQEDLKWMVGYRKETYKKWHCENAMRWLTREGMITTTRTTRGMLIKVLKYDKYQDPKNYENNNENIHENRHENNTRTDTINKNEKNEKNKEYINSSKEPKNMETEKKGTENIAEILKRKGMLKKQKTQKIKYEWQEKALKAIDILKDGDKKRASIFKCYKENERSADFALGDCKELGQLNVLYFLKLYNIRNN
jgi:hypothetical protein